jgi:glycosyltransferase involved in cell wall biosynthesis
MKVLHVIPAIAACYGGPSKVVIDTCRALRDAGIDADIATTNADENGDLRIPVDVPALVDGVPVYFFPRQNRWRYKPSWGLTRWLRDNVTRYDLLHIHALFSYSTVVAARYARKYNVPYIMLPHGTLSAWPLRKNLMAKKIYLTVIEKKNLKRAAAVHFTAEDELLTSVAVGRSNFVLPYVVDLAVSGNACVAGRASQPRILFLSRIDPKKGLDLLIDALGKLREAGEEFEFVIAGSGDQAYERQVESMIADKNLSSVTKFAGFVEGNSKSSLLKSADIFVLPSYGENFGIAVTEAMAAGLPVIVSDRVNIHDHIRAAQAGVVVAPETQPLQRALWTLLHDSRLRQEMGENGARLVSDKFAASAIAAETLLVYRDIIHNSRFSTSWRSAA